MEWVGIGLGAGGLLAAFLVPGWIEALKRPSLEIRASPWTPSGPVGWAFAAVQVHNAPLSAPLNRLLTREPAQACVVDVDFFRWGTDERAMPTVPGRWSSHPQPIRSFPNPPLGVGETLHAELGAMGARPQIFGAVYDPTLDPREHDVPAGYGPGEEVAVAVLMEQGAFAWGTASYAHSQWAHPDWGLTHGTYRIVVRVRGSSVETEATFKLEYLDDDFAKFNLEPV